MRIVLVGAGSREFGPATLRDLYLSEPISSAGADIVLVDIDRDGLAETEAYADGLADRLGTRLGVEATTDLDAALISADFVVVATEVDRYFYWAQDFHLPRSYGFRQIYGENGGPGGLFHALRNMTFSVEIARKMERLCPDAWLFNYTNPLAKLCEAQTRLTSTRVVGLCHGVFHGKEQICRILDHDLGDLEAYACGLNHFSWFQSVRSRRTGEDLYPRLRERERDAFWLSDWDDIALSRILLRTFGLYPSPGTNHIGEYLLWADELFAGSALQFFYDPRDGHPWQSGEVPTWIYNLSDDPTHTELFPERRPARLKPTREQRQGPGPELQPSGELAIPLIEGLACGVYHELAAVNLPNDGFVPGLPDAAVVEVPATVDSGELRVRQMDPLPEAVAALVRTQISINRLLADAFAEGSRDLLLQALLLDPTAHSYRQAVELIDRVFELQAEVLPPLAWSDRKP